MNVGMGISRLPNTEEALADALKQAATCLEARSLTMVFYTGNHDRDVVRNIARKQLVSCPFITCAMPGLFDQFGIIDHGISVCVFYGVIAKTELFTNAGGLVYQAGQEVGKAIRHFSTKPGAIFLFPSVEQTQLQVLLRGVYANLGPSYTYFGSGSIDPGTEKGVASGGFVGGVINGAFKLTHNIGHGWIPVGEPMLVTRSEKNKILEFDGQPAVKRYSNMVNRTFDDDIQLLDNKYQLGIPCAKQRYLVRDVISIDGQALECVTDVPQNSIVTLMTTSIPALHVVAKKIIEEAVKAHSNPEFALIFDCMSRKRVMGKDFNKEIKSIFTALPSIPTVGLLTYGEIGSQSGVPFYHNKSLSVVIGGRVQ